MCSSFYKPKPKDLLLIKWSHNHSNSRICKCIYWIINNSRNINQKHSVLSTGNLSLTYTFHLILQSYFLTALLLTPDLDLKHGTWYGGLISSNPNSAYHVFYNVGKIIWLYGISVLYFIKWGSEYFAVLDNWDCMILNIRCYYSINWVYLIFLF